MVMALAWAVLRLAATKLVQVSARFALLSTPPSTVTSSPGAITGRVAVLRYRPRSAQHVSRFVILASDSVASRSTLLMLFNPVCWCCL